jgi:hypothetical protein
MKRASLVVLCSSLLAASTTGGTAPSPTPPAVTSVNKIAEDYVKLVLAMGQHDPDYVDAYYGPPEWKEQSVHKKPLDVIALEAVRLREQLAKISEPADETEQLRRRYLSKQLSALEARVRIVNGERLKFDEESLALYDAVAPMFPETHFQEILAKLEPKLPGEGSLLQRYENWRRAFVIPKEKLDKVFQLAIKACRERTLAHINLPPDENFSVEYVTNKPWGSYNWYKGNYRSVIQVNTELRTRVTQVITSIMRCLRKTSFAIADGWTFRCIRSFHPSRSLPKAPRTSAERLCLRNLSAWHSKRKCSGRPRESIHHAWRNFTRSRTW